MLRVLSIFIKTIGLYDRSTLNKSNISPAVRYKVEKVVRHQFYDSKSYLNDIALLILSENVTLTRNIQIACVPGVTSTYYPNPNIKSIAVGWGVTIQGGLMSNILNNVDLTIHDASKCSSLYRKFDTNSQM